MWTKGFLMRRAAYLLTRVVEIAADISIPLDDGIPRIGAMGMLELDV